MIQEKYRAIEHLLNPAKNLGRTQFSPTGCAVCLFLNEAENSPFNTDIERFPKIITAMQFAILQLQLHSRFSIPIRILFQIPKILHRFRGFSTFFLLIVPYNQSDIDC